ncbi:hypothetical protein D9M70_577380 [compost metagenome]
MFGDGGSGTRAAGGVEDEVAGVGGHKQATLYNFLRSLDNIDFVFCEVTCLCVGPNVRDRYGVEVLKIANVLNAVLRFPYAIGFSKSFQTRLVGLEGPLSRGIRSALVLKKTHIPISRRAGACNVVRAEDAFAFLDSIVSVCI